MVSSDHDYFIFFFYQFTRAIDGTKKKSVNFALMEESKKVCQICRSNLSSRLAKLFFKCMDTHLITFLTNRQYDRERGNNRVARMEDRRHNEPRMSAEEHDLQMKKGDKNG